jgi:predicted PurR-regulated permease PerM
MAFISASTPNATGSYNPKGICQIVGYVCLTGFILDMVILALPPNLGSTEWRVGLIQQFADRSIIFLFGMALVIFGSQANRARLKFFSRASMMIGLIFFLLCLLSVADAIKLQQQTVTTIDTQESQLQTQIRNVQGNPGGLGDTVTPEDLKRASELLTQQASTLKQNAANTVIKTGASSIGNLLIVGVGLIGLGRHGMTSLRAR